ncbi:MAG: pyrimidine-nucleoside phosphorylase [Firmicutes bacterium HGW-Firmicutes-14]|nr:MAG: pyrimidine-nucleoside phosphorylase [Firmicutes bacterium HGW-Firmicutes-14]
MRAYDVILKKRMGRELAKDEIEFLIDGYMSGDVPDYQMAALAMAVFFQGMTARETSDLTMAIVRSGDQVDLSAIAGKKVDKHSTGGVGDKTTLVLGPLVAAAGVPVAKMSGRGLGHTGGTIDKLESIPGFNTSLDMGSFTDSVNRLKIAIGGQTGNLAPADKKLYALRDVTATVDSIPLIASSVMSKKIAAGADAIVLDVKTGSGAFMKTLEDSTGLARAMVDIGTLVGRRTVALITDMDQPLGRTVGNALEVREAIECLMGHGPEDLENLCIALGSQMVCLAEKAGSPEEAAEMLRGLLRAGKGLEKFRELIENQGGNPECTRDPGILPAAEETVDITAPSNGYVTGIDAEMVGVAAMTLGAGRETKESTIDLAVGINLEKKTGNPVKKGDTIAILHINDRDRAVRAGEMVLKAYSFGPEPPETRKLVMGTITSEGVKII